MDVAAMKHMASNFDNIDKFEGDSLEAKYMAEDALSKKFLVSNFTNYKMVNSRPVMEQYNKLLSILGRFTQHKMNMDEAIQLGSHLRIEVSLKVHDSDKPKGQHVAGPQLNIVNDNIALAFMSTSKLNDSIVWHARLSHVYFNRMQNYSTLERFTRIVEVTKVTSGPEARISQSRIASPLRRQGAAIQE
ncbi:hypothetical protein Tco_0620109 [Tanacetum coccineum]